MAAKKVKVIYQDGREITLKVFPRAQVMAEEHFDGFTTSRGVAATYYLGWAALNLSGKETLDYETWLNKIEDVEDVKDEAEEVPPTQPVPSEGDSSESVS